jgi:carbamoyl-phosphate synthase small subunit
MFIGTLRGPSEGLLLLEDGSVFPARAVAPGTRFGEVVFNTSMTGYQEVLTDPSYRGQIVVMTTPHVGNYGTFDDAEESPRPWVEGFVAHHFTAVPSGRGAGAGLIDYLRQWGVPAIDGLDTRALVRRLREHGALRGVITTERSDLDQLRAELAAFPSMAGRRLVDEVTCAEERVLAPYGPVRARVAVLDCGVKGSILRHLRARGAEVVVVPASTPAARIAELDVDGVVLSNGPGDPEPLTEIVATVRELVARDTPTFGICLGHQLLGLAMGGRTFKLKFGHHGGNQPVRDASSGKVAITSQNHGFAVDPASLPASCEPIEYNLNDGTLEGFRVLGKPVFAVQYHPEAAPGPHDASRWFDAFLEDVMARRAGASAVGG